MTTGVWFRNALRLHDNLPLLEAAGSSNPVICFYVFTPSVYDPKYMGINRLYFLLQSLQDLKSQLRQSYKGDLLLFNSKTTCKDVFSHLSQAKLLQEVFYEYDPTPYGKKRDSGIEEEIPNISFKAFHGHTLTNLPRVVSKKGFKNPKSMSMVQDIVIQELGSNKKHQSGIDVPSPLAKPDKIHFDGDFLQRVKETLPHLQILEDVPKLTDLSKIFGSRFDGIDVEQIQKNNYFRGGETEALDRLKRRVINDADFVCKFKKPETSSICNSKSSFKEPSTTGLSPYLALGCISVRQVWNSVDLAFEKKKGCTIKDLAPSLYGQLLFREMFYILNESIGDVFAENNKSNPVINKYVDWDKRDDKLVKAWENGLTGYPYIDALMRQLKTTGWMHHLGRHAVSCFFTRGQLYQDWTVGRDIFDRELVDSDYALNTGNWLWLSGIATYSPPFFRVYNPSPTEKKKSALNFGVGGNDFIRYWVPELKNCPSDHLTEPWNLPAKVRSKFDYPHPIVPPKGGDALKKFKRSLDEQKTAGPLSKKIKG